jgi:hypothetical protein
MDISKLLQTPRVIQNIYGMNFVPVGLERNGFKFINDNSTLITC